jgi:SAM-dependent methyltransferase
MASAPSYEPRLYATVHDGTPGDLAFYRRVCRGASSVLELGCGAGRVLEPLAGHVPRLVGLDLDAGLLALAAERLGPSVELIEADMQCFDLDERFDRIIAPHSALFCLLDDDALDACLRCVRRHLAHDGMFAFDVYGTEGVHEPDSLELEPEALVFVKRVELENRTFDVFERSTWNRAGQRIDATYLHVPLDGEAPIQGVIRQRYLLPDQLVAALGRASLEVTELRSSFAEPDDDVIAIVARPGE